MRIKVSETVVECVAALVDAEPCEEIRVLSRPDGSGRLEIICTLVPEVACCEQALFDGFFDLGEECRQVFQLADLDNLQRRRE